MTRREPEDHAVEMWKRPRSVELRDFRQRRRNQQKAV